MKSGKSNRAMFSKRFLIVVFMIAIIVAGIWYYENFYKIPFWGDLDIAQITLSGTDAKFSIKNGKIFKNDKQLYWWQNRGEYQRVLRMGLFLQEQKENPLLLSTQNDLEKVAPLLNELQKTDEQLVQISQQNFYPVTTPEEERREFHLHPFAFWESFIVASEQYQKLSQNVSEENAQQLANALQDAAQNYTQDAQTIQDDFSVAMINNDEQRYIYGVGETISTAGIFKRDLEKIVQNGQLLIKEITERRKCLEVSAEFCQRMAVDSLGKQPQENSGSYEPQVLDRSQLSVSEGAEISGPYEINSTCWHGKSKVYMYRSLRCLQSDDCIDWSYLADDAFFAQYDPQTPAGKYYASQGVEYITQSSSAPYECNDLSYKPNLATIDDFYRSFRNDQLFAKIEQAASRSFPGEFADLVRAGKTNENAFFAAKYPSQDALEALGNSYAQVYVAAEKNFLDEDLRAQLLSRYLLIREKFSGLDQLIGRVLFHEKNLLQNEKSGLDAVEMRFLYATRMNYSFFFLGFSQNAWQLSQNMEYMQTKGGKEEIGGSDPAPIIDLFEALAKYGSEKISQWQKVSENFKTQNGQ